MHRSDPSDTDDASLVELIDASAPSLSGVPHEVVQNNTRSNLALALGALALAGVLALLFRSPRDATPTSDVDPSPVTEPQAELSVDTTPGLQDGDGPVLGRPTGLSLMVGGSNTPFRVLDLDTGDLVVSETILAPQFVVDQTVIYVSDTMTWSSIPLAELTGENPDDDAGTAFEPLGSAALVVPAGENQVWLTWSRTDGGRDWQMIELSTHRVLREVTTPVEVKIPGGSGPFSGPEVVGAEAGGVFELQADNSYAQVLDGMLVAVGTDEVLVRQCSPTLECVAAWFDRESWTVTSRPAPDADLVSGRLVADQMLLAGSVPQPALGAGLYDMGSGVILRSLGPASLSGATVSPDGRWLVRRVLGRIEVVDVLGGESIVVLNLSLGRGDSIIWIESPA